MTLRVRRRARVRTSRSAPRSRGCSDSLSRSDATARRGGPARRRASASRSGRARRRGTDRRAARPAAISRRASRERRRCTTRTSTRPCRPIRRRTAAAPPARRPAARAGRCGVSRFSRRACIAAVRFGRGPARRGRRGSSGRLRPVPLPISTVNPRALPSSSFGARALRPARRPTRTGRRGPRTRAPRRSSSRDGVAVRDVVLHEGDHAGRRTRCASLASAIRSRWPVRVIGVRADRAAPPRRPPPCGYRARACGGCSRRGGAPCAGSRPAVRRSPGRSTRSRPTPTPRVLDRRATPPEGLRQRGPELRARAPNATRAPPTRSRRPTESGRSRRAGSASRSGSPPRARGRADRGSRDRHGGARPAWAHVPDPTRDRTSLR